MKKYLLSLCMILALVACKEEEKKEFTRPVIKIGVIYPFSGKDKQIGKAAKTAAEMFFDKFNQGAHKYDYRIAFKDNQNNLTTQEAIAQELITESHADVLISIKSDFGAVVAPLAEQNQVIHFSVSTDHALSKGLYNLITSSNPQAEVDALYNKLLEEGAKKIATITVNTPDQNAMFDYLKNKIAQEKKLKIDQSYRVKIDDSDFRIMLYKIREKKPDYIVALLNTTTIDYFMRQYKESGIDVPATTIESFTNLKNINLADNLWYIDTAPATIDFVSRFRSKVQSEEAATYNAEYIDLILQLITFGYEKTGSSDKEQVINYIQNHSTGQMSAIGKITAQPDGIISGEPVIKKIINGKPYRMDKVDL